MKLKSLAAVVAATLSLVALDASACTFQAWVQDGAIPGTTATGGVATDTTGTPGTATLVAGKPSTDTDTGTAGTQGVSRYSGSCGSFARAPGNFTIDGSPNNESTYRARFYTRSGNNGAVVFRARNASNADMITVTYNASGFTFATSAGSASSAAVTPNAWYSVELNWSAGAAMTATVQGAGAAALPTVTTPAAAAGDRIDSAQLGWISGGSGGALQVDAFESRRTTAIGRLCRGDANNNGQRDSGDATQARLEFLTGSGTLAVGQPDCNENGSVDSADATCVRLAFLQGQGACGTSG